MYKAVEFFSSIKDITNYKCGKLTILSQPCHLYYGNMFFVIKVAALQALSSPWCISKTLKDLTDFHFVRFIQI